MSGAPVPSAQRPIHAADAVVDGEVVSSLLRGFDTHARTSEAEGRWSAPGLSPSQRLEVGALVVVTEGAEPVAHFRITEVDGR